MRQLSGQTLPHAVRGRALIEETPWSAATKQFAMTRIAVPRLLIILIAAIGGFWLIQQIFGLVYRVADILLVFGLAWLLKLLLDPLIRRLESLGLPRSLAIGIAYFLAVGGMVGGLLALIPQVAAISRNIPNLVDQITARADHAATWLQRRGVLFDPQAVTNQITGAATEFGRTVAGRAIATAQSLVGLVGRVALVITVSVYMNLTNGRMKNIVRPVIPPRWRAEYDAFIEDVRDTCSSYIRGYFYIVALGTLMCAAILFGFRVPSAAFWLMLIFALRLLPFVGGTLADLLLGLILFFELPLAAVIAAISLVILGQVVLTNVLMPRVMSRELGINPLLVLFAVLLGGKIYGVAGILFAIPVAAVLATVAGKAIKRFLLPAYERPGWWRDGVATTIAPITGTVIPERPPVVTPRPSGSAPEPTAARLEEPS